MMEGAKSSHDATHEMSRDEVSANEREVRPPPPVLKPRVRPVRFTIKTALFVFVIYCFVSLLPTFVDASRGLGNLNPFLLALGFGLQVLAWFFYSLLTRAALGEAGSGLSVMRMFRIQLSTKALTNVVPGGNAAGSALAYRLLTLSGIRGPDAGFALATAGIGSAVVLNVVFWLGLIISVPRRGVNAAYGTAALIGIIVIGIAAFLVVGIMEGQGRAERAVRWVARKIRLDEDRFAGVLHQIADRLEELVSDRQLRNRVVIYALLNWLIDAASLWVFLRAFGGTLDVDALIVAFGLANLLAAIPITPGGIGYVDVVYVATLVGFGLTRSQASLGVATYRFAQFFLPIFLGGIAYLSLRFGPWKIEKRDRLMRLRELAKAESTEGQSSIDFALRFGRRVSASEVSPETLSELEALVEAGDIDVVIERNIPAEPDSVPDATEIEPEVEPQIEPQVEPEVEPEIETSVAEVEPEVEPEVTVVGAAVEPDVTAVEADVMEVEPDVDEADTRA